MKVVGDLADILLRDHPAEDRRFLRVGFEGQRRVHSKEMGAVEVENIRDIPFARIVILSVATVLRFGVEILILSRGNEIRGRSVKIERDFFVPLEIEGSNRLELGVFRSVELSFLR